MLTCCKLLHSLKINLWIWLFLQKTAAGTSFKYFICALFILTGLFNFFRFFFCRKHWLSLSFWHSKKTQCIYGKRWGNQTKRCERVGAMHIHCIIAFRCGSWFLHMFSFFFLVSLCMHDKAWHWHMRESPLNFLICFIIKVTLFMSSFRAQLKLWLIKFTFFGWFQTAQQCKNLAHRKMRKVKAACTIRA